MTEPLDQTSAALPRPLTVPPVAKNPFPVQRPQGGHDGPIAPAKASNGSQA